MITDQISAAGLRVLALLIATISLTAAVVLIGAPAARADGYVYAYGDRTVVMVMTGSKNYANHTQYVSSITIIDSANACDGGTAEAWTSGYYNKRQMCGGTTFYPSRWVASGNGVCGSHWFYALDRWFRGIACITIRV